MDGNGREGSLMAGEEKSALERGLEGAIQEANAQWKESK